MPCRHASHQLLGLAFVPLAAYHATRTAGGVLMHVLPLPVLLWVLDRLQRLRGADTRSMVRHR